MANVVFLWHMHQPYYVNPVTRTAMMPWVRLHSVKGYLDMISVIEDFPEIRVNFNLTPVLVLQIKELADGQIGDLWLDWSKKQAGDLEEDERLSVLENFFKINWENLIRPFPRYWELLNKRGLTFYRDDVRRGARYFTEQELLDLQVWFNLAWCGYSAHRLFPELGELREKGRDFTEEEKLRVLEIHQEILRLVLRKYADAEKRGQVELTTTPFFHPILPLIYDSAFAERSLPGRQFPHRFHWPEDAAAQLTQAVDYHTAIFGRRPRGLWPSEGSVAPELIPLMEKVGLEYFCSDEENLFNSLKREPAFEHRSPDHLELFQGWRVSHDGASVNALFREKPLSDFIGFMAARNDSQAAADHLLHHMQHIADLVPNDRGVIPLILDGENAWETFSDGGESFLRKLYGGIERDRGHLRSCTIEQYFHEQPPAAKITTLHTGSWIGSNFDIWIGETEENRAWDLLGETRSFLQKEIDAGTLSAVQKEKALQEIYAAEGSDWFWWYGPDFSTENDDLFDDLFRQHLKNVYAICEAVAPVDLNHPITRKTVETLYDEPTQFLTPQIDGKLGSFFEWMGAGLYSSGTEQGAMYRSDRYVDEIHFGFGASALFLRLDLCKWVNNLDLAIRFQEPKCWLARVEKVKRGRGQSFTLISPDGRQMVRDSFAAESIIEWKIDLADLQLAPHATVAFQIQILQDGIEREWYPEIGVINLSVPLIDAARKNWIV
jgi:alpha-amylase/alpha-mannosidase (GH57 family)